MKYEKFYQIHSFLLSISLGVAVESIYTNNIKRGLYAITLCVYCLMILNIIHRYKK